MDCDTRAVTVKVTVLCVSGTRKVSIKTLLAYKKLDVDRIKKLCFDEVMKEYFQSLFSLVPFLEPYPFWVKFFCGLSIVVIAIALIGLLFFKPTSPIKEKETSSNGPPATTQKHGGSGDNVSGDKHVYYGDTEPRQNSPEVRVVSLKYPQESGLQAKLEAQGYKIAWAKEEMKAGWEPVVQTLEDGTRVRFKESVSSLNLLKKKIEIPKHDTTRALQPAPQKRELIRRTPHELLSFYTRERTTQEANRLMQPYVGQWIEVSGKVLDVGHGAPDGDQIAVILMAGNDQIECRFSRKWKEKLDRLAKGESIKIAGKISPTQNGSQLYLQECEIQ